MKTKQLGGTRRVADTAYAVLMSAFVVALLGQLFLAGLGAFGGSFGPHVELGSDLGFASFALLVVAIVARVNWWTVAAAVAVAVLTFVAQHALGNAGYDHPWIGGLHAFSGSIILLLSICLALTAVRRTTRPHARADA